MRTPAPLALVLVAAALGGVIAPSPVRAEPTEGPYVHRVLSATSADGLSWTRDEGVRWPHASVPCAVADGERILLYAVDADRGPGQRESTGLFTSTDGLKFEKQPFAIEGNPSKKALDPCVVRDPKGGFRLYYLASSIDGDPATAPEDHEIHVATSDDGVKFKDAGVALRRPGLVDPDVFLFGGTWFCYVFAHGKTEIATSKDGLTFTYQRDLDLPGYGTTAPVALDDGRLRLYAFEQGKPGGNAVGSFVSTDGIAWAREEGVRVKAADDEQITDPYVVRWKGGWKMYFKAEPRRTRLPPGNGPGRPGGPYPGWRPTPGSHGEAPPLDAQGKPNRNRPGPWDSDVLVMGLGKDGSTETLATWPRAGVPTVTRMADGRLLAAHQHFPEDDDAAFDKVAVHTSTDDGRTWSAAQVIGLEGLPEGMRFPFDPTLVPLPDGRVRLYFTSMPVGKPSAGRPLTAIYSAISKDGLAFVVEPGVRFAVEGRPVVDCAVALHKGVFHLFAPDAGTGAPPPGAPLPPEADRPREGFGYHATSADGLAFTRQPDVSVEGRVRWLGNAQSDGESIVFCGTAAPGIWMSTSKDGTTWAAPTVWSRVTGADPGCVKLRDGTWLVIGTGPPREGKGGPPPRGK